MIENNPQWIPAETSNVHSLPVPIQYSAPQQLRSLMPSEHEMAVFHAMAQNAISSKMYGNNYKEVSAVMMIMLSARELGIPPMQALNGGINLFQGKVEISARMMSALIRKAGHKFKVKECTSNQCVILGTRCDTGENLISSFSIAEAQAAGLVKPGGAWTKWPKDMCFARALSRLARQLFSDVIGIGYVEGEISSMDVKPDIEQDSSEEIIEEDPQEDENEYLKNFLNIFPEEDKSFAMEYLKAVQKQFEYSVIQAIKVLMQDEKTLFQKFSKWKNKIKKAEEK